MDLPNNCVLLILRHLNNIKRRESYLAAKAKLLALYNPRSLDISNTVVLQISPRLKIKLSSDANSMIVQVSRKGWNPLSLKMYRSSFVYTWLLYQFDEVTPMISYYALKASGEIMYPNSSHSGYGGALSVLLRAQDEWPSRLLHTRYSR